MSDAKPEAEAEAEAPKKKKGRLGKLLMIGGGVLVLVGGGVGAGLYASSSGMFGGAAQADAKEHGPKLVPKSEQKHPGEDGGEGGEGGGDHGEGGEDKASAGHGGQPTPKGSGGEKYASNYFALEKEFTANLRDSVHFIQVGIAVSTPYDDTVIQNLKTHEIAVRSAVLMALGDTDEDAVFSADGKTQLQRRIASAINTTLKQKEGFGGISNVYFTNFVVQ